MNKSVILILENLSYSDISDRIYSLAAKSNPVRTSAVC